MKFNATRKQIMEFMRSVNAGPLTNAELTDRFIARFSDNSKWKSAPVVFDFRGERISITKFARLFGCHVGYFSAARTSTDEIAKVLERFDTGFFFKNEAELDDVACNIWGAYDSKGTRGLASK